jgi:hypothetical protein
MRAAALSLALTFLAAGVGQAQDDAAAVRRARLELALGGGVLGGQSLGPGSATLRANLTGGDFTLFETRTRLDGAPLWTARLGVRVFGPLSIEVAGSRSGPALRTDITEDFEQASPTVARAQLTQWTLEGSARLELRSLSFAGGRVVPFLRAGGAYLKESSAEGGDGFGGHTLHAGLGPQIRLSSPARGAFKELGLRVEGRLSSRRGGIWRDERYHGGGSVRGELCAAF